MTKGRREGRARDSAGRPLVVVWRSFLNRTGRDTREEFIKKSIKKSSSRSPARARDGLSLAVVSRHLGGGGGTSALGTYVGPRSNTGVTACAARAGTGEGGPARAVSAKRSAVASHCFFSPLMVASVAVGTVTVALATDACDACAIGIDGCRASPTPFGSSSIGSGEGPIDALRDSSGDVSATGDVSGSFARRDARSAGPSSETRIRAS